LEIREILPNIADNATAQLIRFWSESRPYVLIRRSTIGSESADSLPAAPDQTDGNRGKKKCDYLGHAPQSLLAYPAGEKVGIPERDRDQREI
jgi:hypothetical protein